MSPIAASVAARVGWGMAGAARIVLGALWLLEGITKYRAGFGAVDIRLVVDGAAANPRVPDFFTRFAVTVMGPLSDLFGVAVPALEAALGILLILGVLSIPAAIVSVGMLMMYWLADLLTAPYPIMVVLAVVVVCAPSAATRYSVLRLLPHRGRPLGSSSVEA